MAKKIMKRCSVSAKLCFKNSPEQRKLIAEVLKSRGMEADPKLINTITRDSGFVLKFEIPRDMGKLNLLLEYFCNK